MNIHKFTPAQIDDIIQSYISGESEQSISFRYSVSRNVIRARIVMAGINPRSRKLASELRMTRMTPEERLANVSKAHAARRGKKSTDEQLENHAKSRRGHNIGWGETLFVEWLRNRGYNPIHQEPVGKYNIDIGIAPVAVELYIGPHNPCRISRRVIERSEYLRNRGWHIIDIWITKSHFLSERAADQAVVLAQQLSRNPSPAGQEWVIRGDGEGAPTRCH